MIFKAKKLEKKIAIDQFILIGWPTKNPKPILPFLAKIRPKTLTENGKKIDFLIQPSDWDKF